MDWNWFFSALAQSCAAIVAIVGAFLVSKLLADQSRHSSQQQEIDRLFSRIEVVQELIARCRLVPLSKTALNLLRCQIKLRLLQQDGNLLSTGEYLRVLPTAVFLPYRQIEECVQEAARGYEDQRHLDPPRHRESLMDDLEKAKRRWEEVAPEVEVVREAVEEIAKVAREVRSLLAEIQQCNSGRPMVRRALVVLIVLFLVGVILPLAMLPVRSGSSVGVAENGMLFAQALSLLTVAGLFAYLFVAVIRVYRGLVHDPAELLTLERYSIMASYSPAITSIAEQAKHGGLFARAPWSGSFG